MGHKTNISKLITKSSTGGCFQDVFNKIKYNIFLYIFIYLWIEVYFINIQIAIIFIKLKFLYWKWISLLFKILYLQ